MYSSLLFYFDIELSALCAWSDNLPHNYMNNYMIKINETSSSVARQSVSNGLAGWLLYISWHLSYYYTFSQKMFKNDFAAKPQRELKILAEMHSLCTGHGKVGKMRNVADSGREEWDASCCHSAFSRKWRNAIIFYNFWLFSSEMII